MRSVLSRTTEIDNLLFALFRAPGGEHVDALRTKLFESCVTDDELFDLVFVAQHGGEQDWLDGQINRWRESERQFDRARGITLLGLLDAQDAEARLVQEQSACGQSWLGSRAEAASRLARRNQWAKHWFERFLSAPDDVNGWGAFRLFLECVDRRFWLWGPAAVQAHHSCEARRLHYLANRRAIADATRRNERKQLKLHERLVGDKVLDKKAWPWMQRFRNEFRIAR